MGEQMIYDYYYGDESSQFSFYRIPRALVTGEQFKRLSTDAKLLYGLLLDRMGLSAKNGWYDEHGRVYIYYTLEEIQEDLNCGHDKATKLLVELDSGKQCFGLIERVRQGQGKPTKIYVKRFTTRAIPPQPLAPQDIPRLPIIGSPDCGKPEVKTAENPQVVILNQIRLILSIPIHLSIHRLPPSPGHPDGWIDTSAEQRSMKISSIRHYAGNLGMRTWNAWQS